MPKVTIKGMPGLDGEHPLEMPLLARDYRTIKKVAGVRANEIIEAIQAGDIEVVVAFADIALTRANIPHHIEQLWAHVPGEQIVLDFSDLDEAADALPPPSGAEQPASETKSSPVNGPSGAGSNGATESSQETSTAVSSGTLPPAGT